MPKLRAPSIGSSTRIIGANGQPITPDANGVFTVTEKEDYFALLLLGAYPDPQNMPDFRHTVAQNAANAVFSANAMAYGKYIIVAVSGAANDGVNTHGNLTYTTETASNILKVLPNPKVMDSWMVRVLNLNTGTLTISNGVGVTFRDSNGNTGDQTIASNKWADFFALYDSPGSISYWNSGGGNAV